MNTEVKFSDFIRSRRKELDLMLREVADAIGVTPPYLTDLEKGRRAAPDNTEILSKLAVVLRLDQNGRDMLYDLVAQERDSVAPDIPQYIKSLPMAQTALRKARNAGKQDDFWRTIVENLDKEGNER